MEYEVFQIIMEDIKSAIYNNGIDWIVSGAITAITTSCISYRFYKKMRVRVSKDIIERGLRSLLNLSSCESLPNNAKAIFVEYKGRYFKLDRTKNVSGECSFGEKIRKLVAVVGGEPEASKYKPIDYGVLGVANIYKKTVLFNFQNGELLIRNMGCCKKVKTFVENGKYFCKLPNGQKHELSAVETSRDIMIAVPIKFDDKILGGVTFDMKRGAQTIYQNILDSDRKEEKRKKENNNNKVFDEARRTAQNLAFAYFMKKGEDI